MLYVCIEKSCLKESYIKINEFDFLRSADLLKSFSQLIVSIFTFLKQLLIIFFQ